MIFFSPNIHTRLDFQKCANFYFVVWNETCLFFKVCAFASFQFWNLILNFFRLFLSSACSCANIKIKPWFSIDVIRWQYSLIFNRICKKKLKYAKWNCMEWTKKVEIYYIWKLLYFHFNSNFHIDCDYNFVKNIRWIMGASFFHR